MMNYAPTVNDRSGEILGAAGAASAEISRQGNVAAAQAVSDAINNISQMYAKKQQKAGEDAQKANTNIGTSEAIANMYGTYGTQKQRDDYAAGVQKFSNNQDKLAGYNAMHIQTANAMVQLDKAKQLQKSQNDGALELARQKQALGYGGGGAAPTYGVDVADGINIY